MLKWNDVLTLSEQSIPSPQPPIEKSPQEWQALLTAEQYHVTRNSGTESPFSSNSCTLFEPGLYHCSCCAAAGVESPLFDASEKFDSGTGWPSFTQAISDTAVTYINDSSHGMVRIEAQCNTCKAHLGHVFPDGPAPSGLRYCINAVSLKKVK